MTARYPLCQALGVKVFRTLPEECDWVDAVDLEAILAAAPVVSKEESANYWANFKSPIHTHTARLLCVQPIVKDDAESLLKELIAIEKSSRMGQVDAHKDLHALIARARNLLGQGE